MAISVVFFSFSRAAQPEARGPTLLSAGLLYRILSLTGLVFKLTDFLSSPNYMMVQSPTQSLEWHVWSSSSGNNCHAVHRSLSSGASVYDYTMGFYLVPYCQQSPPARFLPITAIGICHFLPVHHFGMACLAGSKVNIQHLFVFKNKNKQKLSRSNNYRRRLPRWHSASSKYTRPNRIPAT